LQNKLRGSHTSTMTLKTASLLALVGTGLLAVLLAAHFILDLANAASGLVPDIQVLTSFTHTLAGVSVAVFFYVFYKGVALGESICQRGAP